MTRKMTPTLLTAITLCFCSASFCQKELKIGFISLKKISDESLKKKDFQEEINKLLKDRKLQRDAIEKEIENLRTAKALSGPEQAKLHDEKIRQKTIELMEFDRESTREVRKRQDAFEKEILEDVAEAVKEVAEEKGYTWVVVDEVLMYRDDSADLTYWTLAKMNDKYTKSREEAPPKKEAPSPEEEPLPASAEDALIEQVLKNGVKDRLTIKEIQPRPTSSAGSITMKSEGGALKFVSQYPKDMSVGAGGIVSAPMGDKSVWRFVREVPLSGYTFNGLSDKRPLTFILLSEIGLVHLYGRGTVTFPDGKSVSVEEEKPLPVEEPSETEK